MFNNPFSMVVAIVAMVMIARVLLAKYRYDQHLSDQRTDPDADRLREEVKMLRDRVAVLERIATDRSTSLEREIDALRDRP